MGIPRVVLKHRGATEIIILRESQIFNDIRLFWILFPI